MFPGLVPLFLVLLGTVMMVAGPVSRIWQHRRDDRVEVAGMMPVATSLLLEGPYAEDLDALDRGVVGLAEIYRNAGIL
jgi:hypothetical protein